MLGRKINIQILTLIGTLLVTEASAYAKGKRRFVPSSFNYVSPAQSYQSEGTRVETGFFYSSSAQDEKYSQNSPLDTRLTGSNRLASDYGYSFSGFLMANDLPMVIGIKAFGITETGSNTFNYASTVSAGAAGSTGTTDTTTETTDATDTTTVVVAAAEIDGYTYKLEKTKIVPSLTYILFDSMSLGLEIASSSISATTASYSSQSHSASVVSFGFVYFSDLLEGGFGYKTSEKVLSTNGIIEIFEPTTISIWTRLFMGASVTVGTVLDMTSNPEGDDGEKNGISAAISSEIEFGGLKLEEKLTFLQAFHENNGNMLARNVGGYLFETSADYNVVDGFTAGGGLSYLRAAGSYADGSASRQMTRIFLRTGYDF